MFTFRSRMRIVHVITRLVVGGAQENTLISCEGQHARGHDVTLITGPSLGPEGSLMARAKAGGYRVIEVDEMRRSILPVKEAIGVALTSAWQLDPEQSTAALVVHHPAAKYFSVS